MRFLGLVLVAASMLMFAWVGYGMMMTGGFQNDVPAFLSYQFVEVYGALLLSAGIVLLYLAVKRSFTPGRES